MQSLNAADIRKLGIRSTVCSVGGQIDSNSATHNLFNNMVRWGWVDGVGRPLGWRTWQRTPGNGRR